MRTPSQYRSHGCISWFVAVLLFSCGCNRVPNWRYAELPIAASDEQVLDKTPKAFEVEIDGSNLSYHAPQVAAAKAKGFGPRIDRLLKEGDELAARQLLYSYPELATETLRTALSADDPKSQSRFIAREYDRWLQLSGSEGWTTYYETDHAQAAVTQYENARQQLLDSLQGGTSDGRTIEALLKLSSSTKYLQVQTDAHRTAAIAHLVGNRPAEAVAVLEAAVEMTAKSDRYQQSQLLLLLSDARRRAGQGETADKTWVQAIAAASQLTQLNPGLFDPAFWDAASYLRPINTDWPSTAVQAIARRSPIPSFAIIEAAADHEAIVWGTIGQALLDRGESESALVAFKRAESATDSPEWKNWLRLAQANSLARVGQTSAAMAILAGAAAGDDQRITAAANACLGAIKCHGGDADTGYRLLKKGVNPQLLEGWIGLADAEADLGLACLMRGDERAGLQWLHSAQARYEAKGDWTCLAQSLENEREYWTVRKDKAAVASIENRLAELR